MCALPSISDLEKLKSLRRDKQNLVERPSNTNELTIVHLGEEVVTPNEEVSHHDIIIQYEDFQDFDVYH